MLSKLIFLILFKNFLTANPNNESENNDQQQANSNPKNKKKLVEFIEDVSDQTYLRYLHDDEIYALDLHNFSETLKKSALNDDTEGEIKCPKNIFDNFKFKSYFSPLTVSSTINECPNMKNSCCTSGTMHKLKEIWEFKYYKYLKYNQYYFKYYVMTILKQHEIISKMAERVNEVSKDRNCAKVSEKLISFKINDSYIRNIENLMDNFIDFDEKLKHSFMCFFCDYESIKHWDIEGKTIAFSYKFCNWTVENTLEYYYLMNAEIYKYINTANFLTKCINFKDAKLMGKMDIDEAKDSEFLEIDNSMYLHQCKLAKDKKYNLYTNCLNFCSKFDLWYPSRPMYRSAVQLSQIYKNIREKIFKEDLEYDVTDPSSISNLLPLFEIDYNDRDVFNTFDRVFVDQGGIKPETLFSATYY